MNTPFSNMQSDAAAFQRVSFLLDCFFLSLHTLLTYVLQLARSSPEDFIHHCIARLVRANGQESFKHGTIIHYLPLAQTWCVEFDDGSKGYMKIDNLVEGLQLHEILCASSCFESDDITAR